MALHRSGPPTRWWSPSAVGVVLLLAVTGTAAALGVSASATAAAATWSPTTATTDAPGAATSFSAPVDVRYTRSGALLVADFAGNGVVRRDPDGTWSVVVPFGTDDRSMWNPSALVEADDGRLLVAEAGRRTTTGGPGTIAVVDGHDVARRFPGPSSRAVSELAVDGARLFATAPGSGALWETDTSASDPVWRAVDGPWTDPAGVALSADGSVLTVADGSTDGVWQVERRTGTVTSLGTVRDDQGRVRLRGVALLADGSVVVGDNGGGRVYVRQDGDWAVALSGAPDGSPMMNPTAVTVGPGDRIAVADYNQRRVVEATPVGGAEPPSGETGTVPPSSGGTPAPPSAGTPAPAPVPSPSTGAPTPAPAPSPSPGGPAPAPAPSPSGAVPAPGASSPADPRPDTGSSTPVASAPDARNVPAPAPSAVAAPDPDAEGTAAVRGTLASTGAPGPTGALALVAVAGIASGMLLLLWRRTTRPTDRRH
ncbi:hypothetical protein [Curtobacterium sp. SORGH_AS_0776]|uniref:hypothetical protein n=1 Tax=Curtobacterium sp. SORGH_AS_0776 TaxID=3041798 RepID=UPI00285F1D38|nr:hypothetical protein [Curtobacterium sp. SORGH_AS_0776]MDR6170670.1 hypothetical protein [Curtobacterium sp. SORGH_AS_0776]